MLTGLLPLAPLCASSGGASEGGFLVARDLCSCPEAGVRSVGLCVWRGFCDELISCDGQPVMYDIAVVARFLRTSSPSNQSALDAAILKKQKKQCRIRCIVLEGRRDKGFMLRGGLLRFLLESLPEEGYEMSRGVTLL